MNLTDESGTAESPPARSTQFVATVRWDADSELSDVTTISDALQSEGYDTRMADDNSQLLVMREKDQQER